MKRYHWVGSRLSDINGTDLYSGATTLFGGDESYCVKNHTRINHNKENEEADNYIAQRLKSVLGDPETNFVFYDPSRAFRHGENIISRTSCLNKYNLLRILNEKTKTRDWISSHCETIPTATLADDECKYERLIEIFPGFKSFVVQADIGSGGYNTYLIEKEKSNVELASDNFYLASPYFSPSISLNVHAVIYEKKIQLFPASLQIVIPDELNRLIYRGADFHAFSLLSESIKEQLYNNAAIVCEQLRRFEYKGIVGIDFLLYDNKVLFVEVNPRFQASTSILNEALLEKGLPSIHELNLLAFSDKNYSSDIPLFDIKKSNFCYIEDDDFFLEHIKNCCKKSKCVSVDWDGYKDNVPTEEGAYQFRVIFPHSISGQDKKRNLLIHDNIIQAFQLAKNHVEMKKQIKFELLNQGIRIADSTMLHIEKNGTLREAVFDAIDIIIFDNIYVNCPFNVKLSDFSPYEIIHVNNKYLLKRYSEIITALNVYISDVLSGALTSSGIEFKKIATLTTDRVRINHTSVCLYKKKNLSCKFCNLPTMNVEYSLKDIFEVIDEYIEKCEFRHFLIGGGSDSQTNEVQRIVDIAKYIKSKCNKPVYAMCLPPSDFSEINALYDSGIDEIAFNIEIFNVQTALTVMPGKGVISRERYFQSLEQATSLWGRTGNVKSIIILGFDTENEVLEGVERLCEIGVQPILSVFRPLCGTDMEENMPPSTEFIKLIYNKSETICEKFNMNLGPNCIACQNNTLSFQIQTLV